MRNKILIVDDETDIVSMLKDYFELNGYDTITAVNGLEAIQKAEKQPDIILLDINMPDIDGMEVCMRIRDFDKRDLPKLKKKYNIIGMHSQGNKTYIRFLSDVPILDAESCEPNIEDAYMFYLWHNGATIELSGGEE